MARNLAPTKGNLITAKRSRELAKTGFELMDRKRHILIRELMALIDQAKYIQDSVDSVFNEAYGALALADISLGGCEHIAGGAPIDNGLELQYRSVMGVEIPIVTAPAADRDKIPYGLADTSSALDDAYLKFQKVKLLIRDLAETENAIYRLAYSIKKTQKRANALRNVVIPGLDESVAKITESLEEKEREEFVRLKVIKARNN